MPAESLIRADSSQALEIDSLSSISVEHNPYRLTARGLFKVNRSKEAEAYFDTWISAKHPDYRVRYIFDHPSGQVEFGSRNRGWFDESVRALKRFGIRRIPWRDSKLLKKL